MSELPGIVNTTCFVYNLATIARNAAARDRAEAYAIDCETLAILNDNERRLKRIARIIALMEELDEDE
jgi:hypothetical protein